MLRRVRIRAAFHHAGAAALLCIGPACSQSHGPRGVRAGDALEDAGDAPDEVDRGCGDLRDNDCPEDSFCYGELACGSVWECLPKSASAGPKPPSCSAAAPFVVCGCDGYVEGRAAGCPHDRYATRLQSQFGGLAAELPGTKPVRCDPTRTGPFAMTYRVRARGFEAYEGKKLYWFLGYVSRGELGGVRVATLEAGGFEETLGPFDGGEAHSLPFFVDLDGDGRCEADPDPATARVEPGGEPIGYASRSGFDLVDAFYEYTLEPAASTESRFCDRFTTAP